MTQLRLGQRVRFASSLRRYTVYEPVNNGVYSYNRRKKEWRRGDFFGDPIPGEGIVIGLRTLSDGYTIWEEEVGYVYEPAVTHRAVLIATDVRAKPVLALLEDVEPLPDEPNPVLAAALSRLTDAAEDALSFGSLLPEKVESALHEATQGAYAVIAEQRTG